MKYEFSIHLKSRNDIQTLGKLGTYISTARRIDYHIELIKHTGYIEMYRLFSYQSSSESSAAYFLRVK